MKMPLLEIKKLNAVYFRNKMEIPLLRGIDLSVAQGEKAGIAGESGCGKTTLALSVLSLLKENSKIKTGKIFYDGEEISSLRGEQIRRIRGKEIAMVFQHPYSSLNPVLKIGFQIDEGRELHGTSRSAGELLSLVKMPRIEEVMDSYPHQLSGGMIQRVMLAVALSGNPGLLVCDEPTTALDKTLEKEVILLLQRLVEQNSLSLLFISHNLALIKYLTEKMIVMYAGIVVEEGSTSDVLGTPSHPYTQLLVSSYPRPGKKAVPLSGKAAEMENLPPGCKFNTRCPERIDICFKEEPPLFEKEGGRGVRCWKRKA